MSEFWSGAGAQGISMLGGMFGARNQHRRQKELMGIQYDNQRLLNQQGHDLQYDMWKKTNYPAQIEMMKRAGLNPAMMYEAGGPGGSTGSQGGGSAASGSAAAFQPMDVSALLQGKQMEHFDAMIKKLKEEADNINKDTDLKEANINSVLQGIENQKAVEELTKVQTRITKLEEEVKKGTVDSEIWLKFYEMNRELEEAKSVAIQNNVDEETIEDNIFRVKNEAVKSYLENVLTQANISKTDKEIEQIEESIKQKWRELDLKERDLNRKDFEANINRFKAELDAEYPGLTKVWGKMANNVYDLAGLLDSMFSTTPFGGSFKHLDPRGKERNRGVENKYRSE